MFMNKKQQISAVGRSLSEANVSRIRQIYSISREMLAEAGELPVTETIPVEATAGASFGDRLQYAMWRQSLNAALEQLTFALNSCAHTSEESPPVDEILSDFSSEIESLFSRKPIAKEKKVPIRLGKGAPEESRAQSDRTPIECSIAIDVPVDELETVEVSAGANHHPIRGVLFRIDEPSESAPSIGTGKPLYVPRAIAEQLLEKVNGLPLDADDSLSRHANDKIVGVMVKAEIIGNDFIVEGHLWPWNNRAKVSLISANNGQLGMSMNAYAKGRNEIVDGIETFWIEELDLLGANILFRDRATYRKTHFAAGSAERQAPVTIAAGAIVEDALDAESATEEGAVPIEAASRNSYPPNSEELEMNNTVIQSQLEAISRLLTETVGRLGEEIAEVRAEVLETESRLEGILAKERQEMKHIEASRRQEAEAQERQETVAAIVEAVTRAINPSGQPRRISTPLAAGGASAPEKNALPPDVVELLCERASLDAQIQASENDLQKQLALVDRKRDLNVRLSQMGYTG